MGGAIELHLETGDLIEVKADVVLLKHAQSFYSADGAVARALEKVGIESPRLEARPGELRVVDVKGALGAARAAFLGTASSDLT